ncbi:MAG: DUF99 family protein [Gemmatimonadota bacterium]|nr:MAG: DUF99 family protein [Gemmatimonadota bacterium]
MKARSYSHVVGFDDAPFARGHRGDVPVVGAVFAGLRLEGVLSGKVRRDGANAARNLAGLVSGSKYAPQLQLVLLQGIALAGFNVVDLHDLQQRLDVPVMVVARKRPRLHKVRRALSLIPGGERKWRIIEELGPPEPVAGVYVQRVGIGTRDAERVIRRLAVHGNIPEPLRAAHLIAGGLTAGQSRGRT